MDDFKVPIQPPAAVAPKAENDSLADKPNTPSSTASTDIVKPVPKAIGTCPYKVPPWSATPPAGMNYKFEVLKSGQIIEEVDELHKQAFWKFGRLPKPANDLELAHPTISRFHAVLQYRPQVQKSDDENDDNSASTDKSPPAGWYIYDLDSTHGTFLNKQRIPPRVYIRMRVGYMLRLGASTRSYILQGPVEDEEPESELSVTELREQHQRQVAEAAAEAKRKAEEAAERERNEGISWGMTEDADEETDLTHNPYAATNNEELFLDDPKRTLRGYFEREGLQLEYKCDEMSVGSFVCRVELPIDDAFGRPIVAEVVHKGRKKECVVQCALEACRILDRHGVLRQANQEPLKRKVKSQSDSDEDDFLDRTGDIERKKMRKSNTSTSAALTYEDLLKQEADLADQLQKIEAEIDKYQETRKRQKIEGDNNSDDLDSFMEHLKDDVTQLDKTEIRRMRVEQQRIKADQQKVQRLLKIAKPVELPFMQAATSTTTNATKKQLPIIGKRNQFSKFKVVKVEKKPTTVRESSAVNLASDEEEMEEEENVDDASQNQSNMQVADEKKTSSSVAEQAKSDNITEAQDENINATTASKMYGPALVPTAVLEEKEQVDVELKDAKEHTDDLQTLTNNEEQAENEKRRRRQRRQRLRHKRQEVDIDELEEHESSEKYAKWVPPENQSGDGFTKLNEKYGY